MLIVTGLCGGGGGCLMDEVVGGEFLLVDSSYGRGWLFLLVDSVRGRDDFSDF